MENIKDPKSLTSGFNKLCYKVSGNGPKSLLLFHGFGQDHKLFDGWQKQLGEHFTLYAFDLFYHGQSQRNDTILYKMEWSTIINEFLIKEQILNFSVLGFSLGGRFAIATLMGFSYRIENIYLIAPDGIFKSLWYQIATFPFSKPLFKYLMTHPQKLTYLLNNIEKIGLANHALAKFARKEVSTDVNRKRVFQSWVYFKRLTYNPIKINEMIESLNDTNVYLILGKKDNIIPPQKILNVLRNKKISTIMIDCKHNDLIKFEILKPHLEMVGLVVES